MRRGLHRLRPALREPPTPSWFLAAPACPNRGFGLSVRLLVERDGRRSLRALDERCPERTVDAGNETNILGIVVLVGNTV